MNLIAQAGVPFDRGIGTHHRFRHATAENPALYSTLKGESE